MINLDKSKTKFDNIMNIITWLDLKNDLMNMKVTKYCSYNEGVIFDGSSKDMTPT